jgi:hypothetical protein
MAFKFKNSILDVFAVLLISIAGYFLISFYLGAEYLSTGYQDWIYHAFRVKSLVLNGLSPWDHIWSNGINHWQGYPFYAHYLVMLVMYLFKLNITQSMLLLTFMVFVSIRLMMYGVMRKLKISPFPAFFATMVSFAFSHQWISISDFSIFIVMLIIPFYMYIYARASENKYYLYFLAALSGLIWALHPVVGYTLTALFVLLVLFRKDILKKQGLLAAFFMFILGFSYFFYSTFLSGYSFANPIFSSNLMWKQTINSSTFGLSIVYFALMLLGWFVIFLKTDQVPRWAKILHLFCSFYLLFIWSGLNGYLPGFVGSLQVSRAIAVIGMMLPFSFAAMADATLLKVRSRFLVTIFVVVIAVSFTNAIEMASRYTGQPVKKMDSPVARYFGDQVPNGSIYVDNVSEASYFGNSSLRFVNSYNEHREAHPHGQRFRSLMLTDSAYTGVTQRQLILISVYSQVLGVEYLFLPELSPLVDALTEENADFDYFDAVTTENGVFVVLRYKKEIANAYVVEKSVAEKMINFADLEKPSLYADSYKNWDDEFIRFSELISNQTLIPVPMQFVPSNGYYFDFTGVPEMKEPSLLITQSYDSNWAGDNGQNITIKPTSLRFMFVTFESNILPRVFGMTSEWPVWHWLLLGFNIANVAGAGGIAIIMGRKKKGFE